MDRFGSIANRAFGLTIVVDDGSTPIWDGPGIRIMSGDGPLFITGDGSLMITMVDGSGYPTTSGRQRG